MRRLVEIQKASIILTLLATLMLMDRATAQTLSQSKENAAGKKTERRLVVSLLDRKMAVIEDGEVVKTYNVSVGKASTPSPEGDFQITNRIVDPTYYHEGKVIGPGKDNPVGSRWMGLSQKGFGIHGTNEPKSIGKAKSHGCIRMAKKDLEELFARVQVGDTVQIRGERDDEIAKLFPTLAEKNAVASNQTAGGAGNAAIVTVND